MKLLPEYQNAFWGWLQKMESYDQKKNKCQQ